MNRVADFLADWPAPSSPVQPSGSSRTIIVIAADSVAEFPGFPNVPIDVELRQDVYRNGNVFTELTIKPQAGLLDDGQEQMIAVSIRHPAALPAMAACLAKLLSKPETMMLLTAIRPGQVEDAA